VNPIPVSFNHIALDVADRERSATFYGELLGARAIEWDEQHRLLFLRLPGSAHFSDIALHEHPDRSAAYPVEQVRLAHTGWSVNDPARLLDAHDYFTTQTRVVMCADFGGSLSVMGLDPDGHAVEFEFSDVSVDSWQREVKLLTAEELHDRVAARGSVR
jgi:catechol-2,3-dioxygenase